MKQTTFNAYCVSKDEYLRKKWSYELNRGNLYGAWVDFSVFMLFVLCLGYEKGNRIERIDHDRPFEPGNLRLV